MRFYWRLLVIAACFCMLSSCVIRRPHIPKLPKEVNHHIQTFQAAPVHPFYMGEQDTLHSAGIPIWYEAIGAKDAPAVLLIMGHSTSGLAWSRRFIDPMLAAGYRVIRYDNRDVGGSGWTEKGYDLSDMALDGVRILDQLGIDKAHIVGISMGGMIGQHFVLEHPDRALSLSALSTSGYYFDPQLKSVTLKVAWANVALGLRYGLIPQNDRRKVKYTTKSMAYLQNQEVVPLEMMNWWIQRKKFAQQEGRKSNPKAGSHHTKAIRLSGSRLNELQQLRLPSLVVHGTGDRLILPEHGEKLAATIPDCELVILEGMSHIPSPEDEKDMAKAIITFLKRQQSL